MKRRIYIYQNNLSDELISIFGSIGDNIIIENIENDIITLLDTDYYNPEPIDLEAFQLLLLEDFDGEVTTIVEPYLEDDFSLGKSLRGFIKNLPHNVYYFEDIITFVVLKNNKELKKEIVDYIIKLTNLEVVHTVREFIENNMNSSVSAKKLYMHRNTLNYRIENFIEATNINVKTFKGANAIYMLFKY